MAKATFVWEDPFLLDQQLSEEERMIREAAAAYCNDRLMPRVREAFRHEKTDPAIFREMGEMGLLGPTLRAEVGDTIKILFKNKASRVYSMHPHGVFYEKPSEGSMYADDVPHEQKMGSMVPPGGTFTYEWLVPERAGPGPEDPNSIVWLYHSHVNEYRDVASGLVGAITVASGQAALHLSVAAGIRSDSVARWLSSERVVRAMPNTPASVGRGMTVLFAANYRILPGTYVAWRDAWIGAVIASLLFAFGKFLIAEYIGSTGVVSVLGAAGTPIVVLMWVYYSAQIFLLGAEVAKSNADYRGEPGMAFLFPELKVPRETGDISGHKDAA